MCGSHSIPAPGPAQLHMGTMPRLAVLLLLLLSTASAHRPPVARVDDALTAAIAALQSAVDAAGAAGFVVTPEQNTLWIAEFFVNAIPADKANVTLLTAICSSFLSCASGNSSCAAEAAALASKLPVEEFDDAVATVRAASAGLAAAMQRGKGGRLPCPTFNASELTPRGGYFRSADGTPRFTSGFNMWDQTASYAADMVAPFAIGAVDYSISLGTGTGLI